MSGRVWGRGEGSLGQLFLWARGMIEKSPVPWAAWKTFDLVDSSLTVVSGSLVLLRTGVTMKADVLGKHHSK